MQYFVLLAALVISAYGDWKEKKVSVNLLLVTGISGVVLHMAYHTPALGDMLGGIALGALLLPAAWITRESIGTGDGLMVMVSGIYLGFQKNMELFLIALLLAGCFGLFLILVKRKERNYRIPFIPFLLVSYLLLLIQRL